MARGPLPPYYLITDQRAVGEACLVDRVLQVARAGVGLAQLRERELSDRALTGLAKRLQARLSEVGAKLLINDRLDIALAAGLAGVHLSAQRSVTPKEARAHLPQEAVIGVSTHTPEEVGEAANQGADFVVFGPIFDTPSKRGMGKPVGIEGLRRAVESAPVGFPIYALGGVSREHLGAIRRAGAYGVAAIRGWLASPQPEINAGEWIKIWEAA